MLAINSGPIKEFVASDEKQLNSRFGMTFDEFGHIHFVAYANVNRDPGVLLPEPTVFSDLSIIRQDNADLVAAVP